MVENKGWGLKMNRTELQKNTGRVNGRNRVNLRRKNQIDSKNALEFN